MITQKQTQVVDSVDAIIIDKKPIKKKLITLPTPMQVIKTIIGFTVATFIFGYFCSGIAWLTTYIVSLFI